MIVIVALTVYYLKKPGAYKLRSYWYNYYTTYHLMANYDITIKSHGGVVWCDIKPL